MAGGKLNNHIEDVQSSYRQLRFYRRRRQSLGEIHHLIDVEIVAW
jgi:hypothetical protein